MLETPNLVHTLGGPCKHFWKNSFWFDWNLYLYLTVWLEIGHLHISVNICARDLKLGIQLGDINSRIFREIFLVRLELVHVLNGLTWNWTFTCSWTISALGLAMVYDYNTGCFCCDELLCELSFMKQSIIGTK